MANERRNERVKLLANWCNAGSIAMIGFGTLAPVISGFYEWFKLLDPNKPLVDNWSVPLFWLMFGVVAHSAGQIFLEGIVDTETPKDEQ